jgi:hypothetical protein
MSLKIKAIRIGLMLARPLCIVLMFALVMPTFAQDALPTSTPDPTTLVEWIDRLAPWVIIVVLLILVSRNRNLIPKETVDNFIDRAANNAKTTTTTTDDFAVEVARRVRDMLYAEQVTPPDKPAPQ